MVRKWLLVGLGGSARADEIVVRWPSRRISRIRGAAADREIVVREAETRS